MKKEKMMRMLMMIMKGSVFNRKIEVRVVFLIS